MSKFLWTQRSNFGPRPRTGSAIAFDSNRGRTVLFGGSSLSNGMNNDTWEWDGSFWTEMDDIGPFARTNAAMVFDTNRKVTVLFGGIGTAGISGMNVIPGDTWQWDGSDWTQLSESGPTARASHAMAFDSNRNRIVLFGGASTVTLGDTWEFDGQDWTQVQDIGPEARSAHCMAYDSVGKRSILFGGFSINNSPLNDTWAWDGNEWVKIGEFGPSARFNAAMASNGGSLVLFGGGINPADPATPAQVFADTWEFDGKLWTQMQDIGPGPLQGTSMAFDSARGRVVLFGGLTSFKAPEGSGLVDFLSGFTWEAPVATNVISSAPVGVASVSLPPNVRSEQPVIIHITLTGPAPQGGAVVFLGGPIFRGVPPAPVTIAAGLTSADITVTFMLPGVFTLTAQIQGTPLVTIPVVLEI
jgi:hypothetical protein